MKPFQVVYKGYTGKFWFIKGERFVIYSETFIIDEQKWYDNDPQIAWDKFCEAVDKDIAVKNQCDGCNRELLVEEGLHYSQDGQIEMACSKDQYDPTVFAGT